MNWQNIVSTQQDYVMLLLRLALGIVLFPHGMGKLMGWFGGYGIRGTTNGLMGMGIPKPLATLVILGEGLGSVALVLGFLGRITAVGIFIIMFGAMLRNMPYGWFMNWYGKKEKEGIEYFILLLPIVAAIIINGSGSLSIDYYLFGK